MASTPASPATLTARIIASHSKGPGCGSEPAKRRAGSGPGMLRRIGLGAASMADDTRRQAVVTDHSRPFLSDRFLSQFVQGRFAAVELRPMVWGQSYKLDADEQVAAGLTPIRKKPAPSGFGGPGGPRQDANRDPAEASRAQYNALEMRGFANGKRTVVDIRDALSAEYGAQPVAKVLEFFRGLEMTGEFELKH